MRWRAPSEIDRHVVQAPGREPLSEVAQSGNDCLHDRQPDVGSCLIAREDRHASRLDRAADRVNVVDDVGAPDVVEVAPPTQRTRRRREVRLIGDRRVAQPGRERRIQPCSTPKQVERGKHLIHLAHGAHRGDADIEMSAEPGENLLFVAIGEPRHGDHRWNANVVGEVEEPDVPALPSIEGARRIPFWPVEIINVDRRTTDPVVPPNTRRHRARRAHTDPAATPPRACCRPRTHSSRRGSGRRAPEGDDRGRAKPVGRYRTRCSVSDHSRRPVERPYPRRLDPEPSREPPLGEPGPRARRTGLSLKSMTSRGSIAPRSRIASRVERTRGSSPCALAEYRSSASARALARAWTSVNPFPLLERRSPARRPVRS